MTSLWLQYSEACGSVGDRLCLVLTTGLDRWRAGVDRELRQEEAADKRPRRERSPAHSRHELMLLALYEQM